MLIFVKYRDLFIKQSPHASRTVDRLIRWPMFYE
jgi:hypothetical protein